MLHRYDSIILTKDNIKKASEICINDVLLHKNGNSIVRNVKTHSQAYKITTKNKQKLYVHENTLLHLVSTTTKSTEKCYPSSWEGTFKEYLEKSKNFKHLYKLKFSNLDFKKQELPIDPYFLGILLGDGSIINTIKVTTMNDEVVSECIKQAEIHNLMLDSYPEKNKSSTYTLHVSNFSKLKNPITQKLKKLNLHGTKCHNKFIPIEYKMSLKEDRLKILAGLIDTDGSKSSNTFDFISKSKKLAEDTMFIARSVGLRATFSECKKKSQNGTEGTYYRLNINGHTDMVPVRLSYKKCTPRKQKKDPSKVGFDIEKINGEFIEIIATDQYLDENFITQY